MNNIFKQNSRFGSLAEEASLTKDQKKNNNKNNKNNKNKINEDRFKIEEDKPKDGEGSPKNENNSFKNPVNSFKSEGNSFKKSYDDRPQMNYNNGYQRNSLTNRESKESIERRALEEKLRKEEADKIEEERLAKALSIDNFPTLGKKENKSTKEPANNSFLAKLKNSIENDKKQNEVKIQEEKKKPKPGWAVISKDPLTGRSKIEYGELPLDKKPEKTENEMAYDVLCALCDLHERRTQEFIDLYGYDTWEKTFKSPNWREEEEYLERMDEEYEALMASDDDDDYNEEEDYTNENDKYWERY
jgi:hypothetical protein